MDTPRERHVETVMTFGGEAVGEMYPAFHSKLAKRVGISFCTCRGVVCIQAR
jgi:hypothetical protein